MRPGAEKNPPKKISNIFCWTFFLGNFVFVLLESSKKYADLILNEIGAKLDSSSNFFSRKNSFEKIYFAYVSEHCTSFGTRSSILSLLRERVESACHFLGNTSNNLNIFKHKRVLAYWKHDISIHFSVRIHNKKSLNKAFSFLSKAECVLHAIQPKQNKNNEILFKSARFKNRFIHTYIYINIYVCRKRLINTKVA